MRRCIFAIPLLLALMALVSCPPVTPPRLRFTEVTVSTTRALPGETIEISWRVDNTQLLKAQGVRIIPMVLQGDVLSQLTEVDLDTRALAFTFFSPVTIQVLLEDEDTIEDEHHAADVVTVNILNDEDAEFSATFAALGDPRYPRLGFGEDGRSEVSFQAFLGFFDRPGSNEFSIDVLEPYLDAEEDFRARSLSPSEADGFGLTGGSRYAPMPSLLFRRGEEHPGPRREIRRTNAYLFGGAFAYSGEPFDVKTDDGSVVGFRGTAVTVEPMFMAVALDLNLVTHAFEVGDIQVGNLSQGLVATLTSGELIGGSGHARGIHGSFETTWENSPASPGTIVGNLKSADVAVTAKTAAGDEFDAFVRIESARWEMPFLPDIDFDGRILVAD